VIKNLTKCEVTVSKGVTMRETKGKTGKEKNRTKTDTGNKKG